MSEPVKYASVTSITGLLPKNLTWWAGNAVADLAFYRQDEWITMQEFTPPGKTARTFYGREARYEYVRRAHDRIKSDAADLGTEIHTYVEAKNLGQPVPSVPLHAKARMRNFDDFMQTVKPRIESAEVKVYHRAGGFHYAGTLDMLCEIDGELAVLDIKTGKGVYEEAALQINAYAFADFLVADPHHPGALQITPNRGKRWYEWHGPAADEIKMPDVQAGYVLHLRDDFWALHKCPISEDLYQTFLALFPVDQWERVGKKGVFTMVMGSVEEGGD